MTCGSPRILGQCKHCRVEYVLEPNWNGPIWLNVYCENPMGHELVDVPIDINKEKKKNE